MAQIEDDDCISGDGWTLRAIRTPGHVDNHVCFLLEEEGYHNYDAKYVFVLHQIVVLLRLCSFLEGRRNSAHLNASRYSR